MYLTCNSTGSRVNKDMSQEFPNTEKAYYQSAIGLIELVGTAAGLKSLIFVAGRFSGRR